MDQPDIKVPTPQLGSTVWQDENFSAKGKIIKITDERATIDFGNKISSYPLDNIIAHFFCANLVLVAGEKETVVHHY